MTGGVKISGATHEIDLRQNSDYMRGVKNRCACLRHLLEAKKKQANKARERALSCLTDD